MAGHGTCRTSDRPQTSHSEYYSTILWICFLSPDKEGSSCGPDSFSIGASSAHVLWQRVGQSVGGMEKRVTGDLAHKPLCRCGEGSIMNANPSFAPRFLSCVQFVAGSSCSRLHVVAISSPFGSRPTVGPGQCHPIIARFCQDQGPGFRLLRRLGHLQKPPLEQRNQILTLPTEEHAFATEPRPAPGAVLESGWAASIPHRGHAYGALLVWLYPPAGRSQDTRPEQRGPVAQGHAQAATIERRIP
mmetsp:Transcript_9673/g.27351  ORF Transcript_9673/g.27351 Transcript_9673/m.27351 type:complete len:245 (+) Transcript_9673:1064-1798(+)